MKEKRNLPLTKTRIARALLALGVLLVGVAASAQLVSARQPAVPAEEISPVHPTFPLLDEDGENVLESGGAVSTMQTCGACHDTDFITDHSFHAALGLEDFSQPGETGSGRAWDTSPGLFGRWNPFDYRYLSPKGDLQIDLGTAAWLGTVGVRHVGGGPGVTGRDGTPLVELEVVPGDPETHVLDGETGELIPWDWQESGVVEMNCFLCHAPEPDNRARIQALRDGAFRWAGTATLLGSGIVKRTEQGFQWQAEAFTQAGELKSGFVSIQDPTNENCGLCHGLTHGEVVNPLVTTGCSAESFRTVTTGQIVSPQRISDSGMNLADKEELTRSWDVHAERLLGCTDCHYSLNNPLYFEGAGSTRPEHLLYDPRRLQIGEYLLQPSHEFARGSSAQGAVAPDLKGTMRRCDSCHSVEQSHDWLPYKDRHMSALDCESCHIPKLYSPARQTYDWTVIHTDGSARTECRGVQGEPESLSALLTGYEPVLLPSMDMDGVAKLAPHNLITSWYWVYGDPPRPVRLDDLKAAYLQEGDYHPGVLLRFDANGNGALEDSELALDSPEKEAFIARRLILLGVQDPRIAGEIQPYSINHGVATGEWATRECAACHGEQSRLTQPIALAASMPGGGTPSFVQDSNLILNGEITTNSAGALFYQPTPEANNLYILGHESVPWIDLGGAAIFTLTLLGALVHAGLRLSRTRQRSPHGEAPLTQVYMYSVYERFWHWLQTAAIMILLFTGLIIHKPDTFGIFSFRYVVQVHNVVAVVLVLNAGLSLFYHLASGEIKQFIPRPRGFFDQAFAQALFYLRGIFRGETHPFEKTPEKKLNPLQQATYFAILNVLLPLQVVTGALMWGAQRFPEVANALGGLPVLAPFHTLIAWLFAAFIVMHVYLTTTGSEPLAGVQAMMLGWEVVETHCQSAAPSQGAAPAASPAPEGAD